MFTPQWLVDHEKYLSKYRSDYREMTSRESEVWARFEEVKNAAVFLSVGETQDEVHDRILNTISGGNVIAGLIPDTTLEILKDEGSISEEDFHLIMWVGSLARKKSLNDLPVTLGHARLKDTLDDPEKITDYLKRGVEAHAQVVETYLAWSEETLRALDEFERRELGGRVRKGL